MTESLFLGELSQKGSDKARLAEKVLNHPDLLPVLFEGLSSEKAVIKYGCEKVLRIISESKPELLYDRFYFFTEMLDWENNFHRWGAIMILSNLVSVDSEKKFDLIFEKYFAPIEGPTLITAGNTIGSAAKIALARPELADRIAGEILKVERANYQTAESLPSTRLAANDL